MTQRLFSDLADARKDHATLLELIIHHRGGWADRAALRNVVESCRAATSATDDAECRQQIAIVAKYAADLFSEEGHRKWDRAQTSGADYLRLQIMKALHAFNVRLSVIEATRRAASERLDSRWKGPLR